MTDNGGRESIESRGCDRNQEFPAHYRAVAGEEDKRCFHFNDGKNKRCLCNYDRCNHARYSLKSFKMLDFFKKEGEFRVGDQTFYIVRREENKDERNNGKNSRK